MNSSGKVLVIFLVITAILLISLTAISLFFFQKETERRKLAEATLEKSQEEKYALEEDIKGIKKQNFLLQEKNKEADERVNDLTDELELEKGLREEMKLESIAIENKMKEIELEKEAIVKKIKESDNANEKLIKDLLTSNQKIKALDAQLKAEKERSQKLGKLYEQKQKEEAAKIKSEKIENKSVLDEGDNSSEASDDSVINLGVELGEIVVIPGGAISEELKPNYEESVATLDSILDGRILSVDMETEFVIVSLGAKDGLTVGNVLSVYRDENYMGDIKITRLQPEMSAADLILPLSIRSVKKDDMVKPK